MPVRRACPVQWITGVAGKQDSFLSETYSQIVLIHLVEFDACPSSRVTRLSN